MLKKIALALVLLVAAVVIYAAVQPSHYLISRSITINAPGEKIFPYLNNSQLAEQWSKWKDTDPAAEMSYSGPAEGVGARTSWTGGKQLGEGSATIVESIPNERVGIKLEYTKPAPMTQDATYLLASSGGQSVVTWKVEGENNLIGRVMCLFMNMDKFVGGMFEQALGRLKDLVEKSN